MIIDKIAFWTSQMWKTFLWKTLFVAFYFDRLSNRNLGFSQEPTPEIR